MFFTKQSDKIANDNTANGKISAVKSKGKNKKLSKIVEFEIDETIYTENVLKDASVNAEIDTSSVKAAIKASVKSSVLKDAFNLSEDKYIEAPWTLIGSYFQAIIL
jgi:hypothetical protein